MMRGRDFLGEFTSAVTNILNKAPSSIDNKKYLATVNSCLEKIHDSLKKNPSKIVSQNGKEEENTIKSRFLYWLINKTLWLKTKEYPEDLRQKIYFNCDKNLRLILEVLAQHDTKMFKEIIQDALVFLKDLATETKYFYEKKDVTTQGYTAAPFGGVNENLDGAFATQESACFFESPKNIVGLMCDILHYLQMECCSLKILTFDYIQQGLWPLLNFLFRIHNLTLFEATLSLSTELLRQDCFANSLKEQNKVVIAIFALLKHVNGSATLKNSAVQMLTLLVEKCQIMPDLKKMCILNCRQIWRGSSQDLDSLPSEVLTSLNALLSIAAVEESTVNILPRMMKSNLSCFKVAFAHTVVKELKESELWSKEKEKLSKIDKGDKKVGRLDGVRLGQVSESWSQFLQLSDTEAFLFKMPEVAMKILVIVQKDIKTCVEMDFVGKDLLTKIVENLTHLVLQQPYDYAKIIHSTDLLVTIQPKDTFTQNTLNLVAALACLPEISNQIKPMDLRVNSETLWHNLMKKSPKVKITEESLKLLTSLMKDVAPRMRLSVIRKLCDVNMDLVVGHLANLVFFFGTNSHPFLMEILGQSHFNDTTIEALSEHAGSILCSLFNKSTNIQRTVQEGKISEKINCKVCMGDLTVAVKVSSAEVEKIKIVFFALLDKFVGHSKAEVQINAIQYFLKPISAHGMMDAQCASLWLHCLDSSKIKIAKKFSFQIGLLLTKAGCNEEVIIERLEEAKMKALKSKIDYQTLVCRCIDQLSKVDSSSDDFQKKLFSIGFDLLTDSKTHIAASMIPKALKTLMNAHPAHSTVKLAQVMCTQKSPKQVVDYATTAYRVNPQPFVEKQLPLLLTIVVMQSCKRDVKPVLDYLAELLGKKVRILLVENFSLIFAKLVTQSSDTDEYQKCTKFLGETIGFSINELVQSDRQKLINELLVQFNSHPKRTFGAFNLIAKHDNEFKPTLTKKISKQQLAGYIEPRFLGVLNFFDQRLKCTEVSIGHKRDIMASLSDIIKMMDSAYIGSVKHKIFSTLSNGLGIPGIPENLLANCWQSFISTININALIPIIGQVIASLLQLYHKAVETTSQSKNKILNMCYNLLHDNREELKIDTFAKLVFIPEEEDFVHLNKLIKHENGIQTNVEFKTILRLVSNSLDNESNTVKILTLEKMYAILRLNQESLHVMILSNEEVDPMISQLFSKLLDTVRSSDVKVSNLSGACLGALGAVDPGRIQVVEEALNKGFKKTYSSVLEEDFAVDLIQVLVKAFLSFSDSSAADSCSFSMQEIIRAYKIKNDNSSRIWKRLEEHTREVLTPLFTSHYSVKEESPNVFPSPIYKSTSDQNFSSWISQWSSHLMTKIEDKPIQAIFYACKPVIRKDSGCAQFLLPYILNHVICKGTTEDVAEIIIETEAVIGGHENVSQVDCNLNGTILSEQSSQPSVAQDLSWMAKQTIFAVLDHMNNWLLHKYIVLSSKRYKENHPELEDPFQDHDYLAIQRFVKKIKQHNLAFASFDCRAYARSLMHLETHIRQNPNDLEICIPKLQQVYGGLNEPDYVKGLVAIRKTKPTLEELIHHHQVIGDFEDALASYESMGNDLTIELTSGLIRCYLEMNRPQTASMLVKGLMMRDSEHREDLLKYQIESAWNLGRWEEIEEAPTSSHDWSTNLAKTLLLCYKNQSIHQQVAAMRQDLMIPISAAAMEQGAYRRCYEYIVRLQILNEIDAWHSTLPEDLPKLFKEWKTRQTFSQYSASNLEAVLKVRRALIEISLATKSSSVMMSKLLSTELGDCWLSSAKVARKTGQLNKAYNLLLEAEKCNNQEVFLERAKLAWRRGSPENAILALENGIKDQYPEMAQLKKDLPTVVSKEELNICGQGKLLLARYVDDSASLNRILVAGRFHEAKMLLKQSEDAHYFNACFFDKTIGKSYQVSELDNHGDIISYVITQYCISLTYGCDHLHQSLARLLSLWLDYASRVHIANQKKLKLQKEKKILGDMQKALDKMNDTIERFVVSAPAYYFLSVLPQLTSRICDDHPEVWNLLKTIIVKTFVAFPNHVFWHMVALSKSSYPQRASRCREILDIVKSEVDQGFKLIDDYLNLADKLIQLSDEKVGVGEVDMTQAFPSLPKLISSRGFSKLLLPMTTNMTVMLPTGKSATTTNFEHNPFPSELVYLSSIEDTIHVMRSLVQPKKVTFRGTNGRRYSFLCKPKDDLRRDCRLLDVNNLLNKLFMKDPECRKRNLHIRTYTVFPLNETNGIIEWVDNLQPFRIILAKLYRQLLGTKKIMKSEEIKKCAATLKDATEDMKKFQCLLDRHPSVFAEWFVRNFPDPQAWFTARLSYTRTTAVMSMVGYLLGLGDRHGENILFDATNGDTVHVDLNCLFEKGRELKFPEVVPFRLTHNMIHAMGPTGTEGPFKITCEVALGLMRKQKDVLMSALRPFYFDPLLDWKGKTSKTESGEVVNTMAVNTLKNIESKLSGLISISERSAAVNPNSLALSVAGQVQYLIKEATSHENLSKMYIGWAPYL